MVPNLCSSCYGEMNPILMKYNHKGHCQSYRPPASLFNVPDLRVPTGPWCTCCGSDRRDERGEIVHQVFCKKAQAEWVKQAEQEPALPEFKTTFTELKTMSVDGMILRASKIASEAHREMVSKASGNPYIHHPMKVAGRVMLLSGVTPVEIAAAWLHDVLKPYEDAAGPVLSMLEIADRGIPPLVMQTVQALCPPTWTMDRLVRNDLKPNERWKMEREWFGAQDVWVKKIKLIDRIDNLMELSWKDKERMHDYCMESRLLLEKIGDCDADLKSEALSIIEYYETELVSVMMSERWE